MMPMDCVASNSDRSSRWQVNRTDLAHKTYNIKSIIFKFDARRLDPSGSEHKRSRFRTEKNNIHQSCVISLERTVYLTSCPTSPVSTSNVAFAAVRTRVSSAASSPLIVLTDRHSRTFCKMSPTRRSIAVKCGSQSMGDSGSSAMDSLMCSLSFLTL